jgi:hypothetical protein
MASVRSSLEGLFPREPGLPHQEHARGRKRRYHVKRGLGEEMRPVSEGEFVQGLVDKVSYSYNVLYNVFKRLSKGDMAAESAAMFHDTAARVYRIAV